MTVEDKIKLEKSKIEKLPDTQFASNQISGLWSDLPTYIKLRRLQVLNDNLKIAKIEPTEEEDVLKQSDLDMIDKIEQDSFPAFTRKDMNYVLKKLKKYGLKELNKVVNSLHSKDLANHDKKAVEKYVIRLMKNINTLPDGNVHLKGMLQADFNIQLVEEAYQYFKENGYDSNKDEFNHLPLPEEIFKTPAYVNFQKLILKDQGNFET